VDVASEMGAAKTGGAVAVSADALEEDGRWERRYVWSWMDAVHGTDVGLDRMLVVHVKIGWDQGNRDGIEVAA
jgi:hypothetical protein